MGINVMHKKALNWLRLQQLKDVVDIADEMKKWSEYLAHSAKQGDLKEVRECFERIEELFNKAKGE